MKEQLNYILRSFWAGAIIGIAGFAYLMIENPVVGALFFSVGLLIITSNSLSLYTGQIGFSLFINEEYYKIIFTMIKTLLFNIIGAALVGILIRHTYLYDYVSTRVMNLITEKVSYPGTGFITGIFCGILIFIGMKVLLELDDGRYTKDFYKYLILILCVAVFVICKFDHCIANVFYIALSGIPIVGNVDLIGFWVLTLLGNSVGSIAMAYSLYLKDI